MPNLGPFELAVIVMWVVPAILVAVFAARRGYSSWLFLLLGLVASFVVSLVVLVVAELFGARKRVAD